MRGDTCLLLPVNPDLSLPGAVRTLLKRESLGAWCIKTTMLAITDSREGGGEVALPGGEFLCWWSIVKSEASEQLHSASQGVLRGLQALSSEEAWRALKKEGLQQHVETWPCARL